MAPIELKRMKLELIKVAAARAELEFKVEERLEDIERIKKSIQAQMDRETELTNQIQVAEQGK